MTRYFYAHDEQRDFEACLTRAAGSAEALGRELAALSDKVARMRPRRRVLVVSYPDEVCGLLGLVTELEREHEAFLAVKPETAYELVYMNFFDLLLCDFELPSPQDGLWLMRQLQGSPSKAKRVLVADEPIEGWEQHVESGLIHRFLVKPVRRADLADLLDSDLRDQENT